MNEFIDLMLAEWYTEEQAGSLEMQGVGADFKRALREPGPWRMNLWGFGECLPRYDNFVELDKEKADEWGIPLLKIHCTWSDNEQQIEKDSSSTAAEMLEAAGAKQVRASVGSFKKLVDLSKSSSYFERYANNEKNHHLPRTRRQRRCFYRLSNKITLFHHPKSQQ